MTKLLIKNNDLIIEDETKQLFEWKHRAFFNISLSFEVDEEKHCYLYSEKNEFQDAVKEIVNYLKEEDIKFTIDNKVAELLSNIHEQESEFSEAKDNLNKTIAFSNPASFQRELKPYQINGLEHFLRIKHGANFSVPGSGKTTMVYA